MNLAYLFPVIVFCYGLYRVYHLVKKINLIEDGKSWIETKCIIKDARIKNHSGRFSRYSIGSRIYFYATYEVDGISFGTEGLSIIRCSTARLRKKLRSIEGLKETVIYYNPQMPHQSVLINPKEHNLFWAYIADAIIFSIALFSLLFIK